MRTQLALLIIFAYERNEVNINVDRTLDQLRRAWEENPLQVIAVASGACVALTSLMRANTHRREVKRRVWMDMHYGPRRRR